ETEARRVLTLNLSAQDGETTGYSAADHVRSLVDYAPDLRLDVVVADPSSVQDLDDLTRSAQAVGAPLLLRQVSEGVGTPRHDTLRRAAAYAAAFEPLLGGG